MNSSSDELHLMVEGTVQGVGFRATAQHYAHQFDLKGTAQNLSDGRVEIVAQGSKEKLEAFVDALKNCSISRFITSMDIQYYPSIRQYHNFSILR